MHPLVLKGLEHAEMATAEWELGRSTYISLDESTIVAAAIVNASSRVVLIDTATASYQDLNLPYLDIGAHANGIYRVSPTSFAIVGSAAASPQELALISLASDATIQRTVLKSTASAFTLPPDYVSHAVPYTAPQTHGPLRDCNVHFFYFPPRNPTQQPNDKSSHHPSSSTSTAAQTAPRPPPSTSKPNSTQPAATPSPQ